MKLFGMISARNRYDEFLAEIEVASDETYRDDPLCVHRKIIGKLTTEGGSYGDFFQFWQDAQLKPREFDGLSHLCVASIRVDSDPYPQFAYFCRKGSDISLVLETNSDESLDN